jgi:tetratricopeptide (TPR) repeat protein
MLIKTFEGDPTKLAEMAQYYTQSASPEDQLKGAESLFKLQQYEQALPIFAKYMSDSDLNHRYNITQRLQFILDTLHQQYASRGEYRKALEYFMQYMQVKPDADPTPYSKYVYMIKRAETDMNNPEARLQLAMLAEQLGLIPTAKEEYRNVLAMDGKSSTALAALRRFAESDLSDAREFLAQNQYVLAEQKAQSVASEYTMYPDLIAQANQVQAQAKVEAEKVAQNTRQQARALAERGDNYYSQAMQYLGAYVSTETDINKRIFSPRNEAAKYLGQAIFAWKTALQLDPSLGDPTTYNLYFKIQDASAKYSQVANRRPPPLPPRVNRATRTQ